MNTGISKNGLAEFCNREQDNFVTIKRQDRKYRINVKEIKKLYKIRKTKLELPTYYRIK